jgi:hypothetical protein
METAGLEGAQAAKLESSEEAPTLHFPKRSNHQPMETGDAPTSWHGSNLGNGNGNSVTRWGWRRRGATGRERRWRHCDGVGDGAALRPKVRLTMVTATTWRRGKRRCRGWEN